MNNTQGAYYALFWNDFLKLVRGTHLTKKPNSDLIQNGILTIVFSIKFNPTLKG